MYYITSNSTTLWYPIKAKTLNGAKQTASRMFVADDTTTIKVGKSSVCGIQCVSKKIGKIKWVNVL